MRFHYPALLLTTVLAAPLQAQWAYDWAAQTISPNVENALNCAVAPDGHVAVTGDFTTDLQMGSFTGDGLPGNGLRGFVSYLDATGAFQWAHVISSWHGSGANDQAWDVAIDGDGNVLVGGQFNDSLLLDGVNVLDKPDTISTGVHLFYVLKFSANGDLIWAAPIGVEGATGYLRAIAVDSNNDVYTVGEGGSDYGRFDKLSGASGAIIWRRSPQGAGSGSSDVTVDANDNVYITGQATNAFTMGGMTCPYNNALGPGSTPLFVGKFNSARQAQWYYVPDQSGSGYFGFPNGNIAVTSAGQSFIETNKFVRINNDTIAGINNDRGLFSLDTDGQVLWARKVNANAQLTIGDVHGDGLGNVLLAGQSYGPIMDLVDTVINSSNAGFNVFVARYDGSTGALTGLLNGPALQEVMGIGVDASHTPVICGTAPGAVQLGNNSITGSWNVFVTRLGSNVGIEELNATGALILAPNPTEGLIQLSLPRSASAWTLTATNAIGQVIWSDRVAGVDHTIDASSWAKGTYLISAGSGAMRLQRTMVVR